MRHLTHLLLALLLLAVPGCDGDDTTLTEPQELSGFWLGLTTTRTSGPVGGTAQRDTVELLLAQTADGLVSGTAVVRSAGGSRVYAVDGANQFPDVILTLSGDAEEADELISVRAEFTGTDALRARLDGGGFNDVRADFFRRELVL